MRCEAYRDTLLEAAAVDREVNERVRNHTEECPHCRATLQQERALFVAIDGTLRARMEEMPRDGFVPAVRAMISQEPEPGSLMSPVWMLAAASVMVALVAIAGPWDRLGKQPVAVGGSLVATTHIQREAKIAEPRTAVIPSSGHQAIKKQTVVRNVDREPEVLVPPDEREALARFVKHLQERDEVARALASPPVDEGGELSEIKPVEIARLQLKPLVWESWVAGDDRQGEEER